MQVREHDSVTQILMPVLETTGGFFYLGENASLVNIGDFNSLVSVGAYFTLRNMPSLTNINGFASLDAVAEDFQISGNTSLPTCNAQALELQLSTIGGTTTITGNLADVCGA
jgi:hypothetical protein